MIFTNGRKLDQILAELEDIDRKLNNLTTIGERIDMSTQQLPQDILDLQAALASEDTAVQGAITLLDNLAAQLTAALQSSNPVLQVENVVTGMKTTTAALAAAVTKDTPVPPAPPAPPATSAAKGN